MEVEGFAGFHFVMDYSAGRLADGGLSCARGALTWTSNARARNLRCPLAARDGQVEIQNLSSGEAAAFDVVPSAKHFRRNAKVLGYRLDRIALAHFVAGDGAGVSAGIALLAGSDRDDQAAFGRPSASSSEVVGFGDRLRSRVICARDRGQGLVHPAPCDNATRRACRRESRRPRSGTCRRFRRAGGARTPILWRSQPQQAGVQVRASLRWSHPTHSAARRRSIGIVDLDRVVGNGLVLDHRIQPILRGFLAMMVTATMMGT